MEKINKNTLLVYGDLYTDMYMDVRLLNREDTSNIIHVKGDVFMGVLRYPVNMKQGDYYMLYEEFVEQHGKIRDIVGFSEVFKITL